MYNKYYTFGGVTLELTGEKAWKLSDLCRPFRAEPRPADHTIHVTVGDDMPQPPEGAAHEATLYRWREGERFCLLLWGLFGHLWAAVAALLPEKRGSAARRLLPLVLGTAGAVALLAVLVPVLASADALFAAATADLRSFLSLHFSDAVWKTIVAAVMTPFFFGLLYFLRRPTPLKQRAEKPPRTVDGLGFAIVLTAVMWFIWNKTTFGKNMFALGSNEEAARVSGVNVFAVTVGVFALAGAMYGFTGFIEGARIGSNTANTGLNYELDAIAACVIGGVSFVGGIGKIRGIVIGVLMLRLIFVGLAMVGVPQDLQYLIKGGIILFACALDMRKYLVKK